jgi:glyceraldehyde 3-phosphate dehydrogenase
MALRVAINGFGRIARCLARIIFTEGMDLEVVVMNSRSTADTLAYLLKYDSAHGIFPGVVEAEPGKLLINGRQVTILQMEALPEELPWRDLGVQLVLEATGAFRDGPTVAGHLRAGAQKVLLAGPGKEMDGTFVFGVNHTAYDTDRHNVISNASCTTNCLAQLVKVLHENFGIEHGLMTTIHSYTMDQRLLDGSHVDRRRGRAAALSIVPTSTGAATLVDEVIPELKGRLDGVALRIPTPVVSIVDFIATVEKSTSQEEVNQAFVEAANGELQGILEVSQDPLVSVDYTGSYFSAIVDAPLTKVMNSRLVKVMAWYDNEMGFAHRMLDMAHYMGRWLE